MDNEKFSIKLSEYIIARLDGFKRSKCLEKIGNDLEPQQFELIMLFDFLITTGKYRHVAKTMADGDDKYRELFDIALSAWMARARFNAHMSSMPGLN